MCALELAFIDLTQRQLAPGDIDALVRVSVHGESGLRIDNAPDHARGVTRLYYAAHRGWCAAITWLLEQGADVHVGWPGGGWTPLHIAAPDDQRDAAVLLLDAGARVDARARDGETALHHAAAYGRIDLCKLLVSRGASLDARDEDGRDPEAHARSYGRTAAADLLAAVRAAGGWRPYVDAPRKELLALRRELPTLFRTGPCRARAQARLFLDARVPDDVFAYVLAFWRGARDL
jgi:hypothetical protein